MSRSALLLLPLMVACELDYNVAAKDDAQGETSAPEHPDIEVSPTLVDYGTYVVGEPLSTPTVVISVGNVGPAHLHVQPPILEDASGPFTITDLGSALIPTDLSTSFSVTLEPSVEGPVSTRIWLDSDDPDEPRVEVLVQAVGEPPDDPIDDSGIDEGCQCPEGFDVRPAGDGCEREVEEPAIYNGDPREVCSIDPYFAYSYGGARYPGGTTEQSPYWGQNDSVPNGRLNQAGVWACDPNTGRASSQPVGEWIGVAFCIELDEPGDYLVGMGADNRVRAYVDGAMIFEHDDGRTQAFNYWWLTPVPLDSGTHVVEMWGKNDGSIAAFGAEVSGPFGSGTLVDDAAMQAVDYEANLAFSTAELVGGLFSMGTTAGWSCPDGSTFNACADEPVCVTLEEAACL